MKSREVKTDIISKKEFLIGLYNEVHNQVIRSTIDNRVAERSLLSNTINEREGHQIMSNAQKMIKIKKETLNIIMDELMNMESAEQSKTPEHLPGVDNSQKSNV